MSSSTVNQPTSSMKVNESLLFSRECPICYIECPTQRSFLHNCGHILCRPCAEQLAIEARSPTVSCPICRNETRLGPLIEDVENEDRYFDFIRDFILRNREEREQSLLLLANLGKRESAIHREILILQYLNREIDRESFHDDYTHSMMKESRQRARDGVSLRDIVMEDAERYQDDYPKKMPRKFSVAAARAVRRREKIQLVNHLRNEDEKSCSSSLDYSRACPSCPSSSPLFRSAFIACGHVMCRECAENLKEEEDIPACPHCDEESPIVNIFEDLLEH